MVSLERIAGQHRYLALVTAGLVALLVAAWWRLLGQEIPVRGGVINVLVLAFVAAAIVGLHWLHPRRTLYALGGVCVLLAWLGVWLGSPAGGLWIRSLFNQPNYGADGGRMFTFLFLLLPIGWVLLSTSVANWKVGVATYLAPGVVLVLAVIGISAGFGPRQMPLFLLPYFLFGWPMAILQALGVLGYTFG